MPNLTNWFNVRGRYVQPNDTTEMNVVRGEVLKRLTDTGTLEAQRPTLDRFGAPVGGWTVVLQDVPCLIDADMPGGSMAQTAGDQETIRSMNQLYVPVGTPLAVNQRITVRGTVYHIVAIDDRLTYGVYAGAVVERQR